MTPDDVEHLEDALAAVAAVRAHLERGPMEDGLVFDAVRMRLVEVAEAVRGVDPLVLAREPGVAWSDVARMRGVLAHRYFRSAHDMVQATVDRDLPPLVEAVERLLEQARP